MKIMIARGGIGGLTAALCLHEIGIEVTIFESANELEELGAGINILPHAVKEYERLGIVDRLLETGVELERYMWFNKFGQEICNELRGREAGYHWPQISIHRGRFQSILDEVVRERLGPDVIRCNHHLSSFEQTGDQVIATFVSKHADQQGGSL